MEPIFWEQKWQRGETGFHQPTINPYLLRYWSEQMADGGRVLLPCCGKSRDLLWLAERHDEVVGVEISSTAIKEAAASLDLHQRAAQGSEDAVPEWCRPRVRCLHGDWFQLHAAQVGQLNAVFDRAALIAFPPSMRPDYAAQMNRLTAPECRQLLVTLVYPQADMQGPPFSVPEEEVHALYGDCWDIQRLHDEDVLERDDFFRARGLNQLREQVYLLQRHP